MDTRTKPSFGCTTCNEKTYSAELQPDIFCLVLCLKEIISVLLLPTSLRFLR